ncbi:hypothetical protein AN963_12045 [Brevibacillus choshinensis]|uniref:Uncharacterized protein n=1 Tax=Brevibacillus choshinensis TaxID=54911 RepID=A0ABR5N553_BRECH|nr:hypothetical protein [Brevibacillus choshinensis]KQL45771.1 hypothetical protein AN963_12045 [Brevibacillus choshinensis]
MTLWVFLALVIGGILLFGVLYESISRRSKRRVPVKPGKYDQTYTEQLLQDTRDTINRTDV